MFADERGNSAEPDPSAVAALVQGVLERKPFLVLTGRKGAGKTAVLDATLQIVSRSGTRIVRLPNAGEAGPRLRRLVGQMRRRRDAEALSDDATKSVLDMLTRHAEAEEQIVLAIDNAHELTPEALKCLGLLSTVMQTAHGAAPQILLVGRPTLGETLGRAEFARLRERIGTELSLGKPDQAKAPIPKGPKWHRPRRRAAGLAVAALAFGVLMLARHRQQMSAEQAHGPVLVMAPMATQSARAEDRSSARGLAVTEAVPGHSQPRPAVLTAPAPSHALLGGKAL